MARRRAAAAAAPTAAASLSLLRPPLWLLLLLATAAGGLRAGADAPGCRGSIPGCGTNLCVNRLVAGRPTLVCPFCDKAAAAMYAMTADQTRCDCVPGAYADCLSPPCECRSCPAGSWCRGGRNAASGAGAAAAVPCGVGRSTNPGIIATKLSDCVLLPGWGWRSPDAAAPQPCAISYYSPGGVTTRIPCTRCPARLTTLATGSVRKQQCVAGPGRFFSASVGGAQPCPAGTYQPTYIATDNGTACTPCPTGVTTRGAATKAAYGCAVALPGYGLLSACDGTACQDAATAALCAVGSYNPGGVNSSSCVPCPWGLTTQGVGATSEDDCRVPPGTGLQQPLPLNRSASAVAPCSFSYNPGWNRDGCTSCGINVAALNNRTSAADCYVLRGQGLRLGYDANGLRVREAVDCAAGSFGMVSDTPADQARPCDTCPRYMTTAAPLAAGRGACAAQQGYTIGLNLFGLQASVACAVGTYKPSISNDSCTPCPGGSTTPSIGATALSACSLCLAGTGSSSPLTGNCTQCTVGFFNNGSFAACQPCAPGYTSLDGASSCFPACATGSYAVGLTCVACPDGTTTVPGTAASSAADCSVCLAGYGPPTSCPQCAQGFYSFGGAAATCLACAANTNTTAGSLATSAASCLPSPGFTLNGTSVVACAVGSYKTNIGNNSCTLCANGTTTAGTGATSNSSCSVCLAGYGPAPTCSQCSQGSHSVGGTPSTCLACAANTNTTAGSLATSAASCLPSPGFTLNGTSVVACAVGSYKTNIGNNSCTLCANGTTTAGTGATSNSSCSVCLAGYGPAPTCSQCSQGSHSVGGTPSTCLACAANTTTIAGSLAMSAASCLPSPGFTLNGTSVVACAVRTYKPSISNDTCTACPGGSTTPSTGATALSACSLCLPGTGSSSPSTVNCTQCVAGTYNDGTFAACQPCASGFTSNAGASACFLSSVCTARPALSSVSNIACPAGWIPVQADTSGLFPPRCRSDTINTGNCQDFEAFIGLTGSQRAFKVQYLGSGQTECACPQSYDGIPTNAAPANVVAGFVPQAGGCVNSAVFLPAAGVSGNLIPSATAGVWLDALTAAQKVCGSHRSCWDLCFFCDGTRRYATQTGFTPDQTAGFRWSRPITAGTGNSTASTATLSSTLTSAQNVAFASACEAFGASGAALPEQNAGLVAATSEGWPYRPTALSGRLSATLYQLVQPLPAGFSVERGQVVMEAFGSSSTRPANTV